MQGHGARTRLFHAIVGLGLAGASAACGSATSIEAGDSGSSADGAAKDAGSVPGDATVSTPDASAPEPSSDASIDADAWIVVPIK